MKIENTSNIKLQKINMAVIGESKSGKTTLASTIKGKPLICNADKGILSLKKYKLAHVTVNSWEEVVDFMKFITNAKQMTKHGYDWVIFDSMTAIARLLKKHLEEKGITGFDFWGEYKKLMAGIMTTTRYTNIFHSLSIYQLSEKENAGGFLEKKFGIEGSLCAEVPYFYDFVFAIKKIPAKKDKPVEYCLQTIDKNGYCGLGGRAKLSDYEPANINNLMLKLLKG